MPAEQDGERYALLMSLSTTQKERIWVLLVVLYGVGKSIVVWQTLGKYGVNALLYFLFDIGAAIPYGIATARVVIFGLARDWPRVRMWGAIAVVTHFIPDLYIFAVLRQPPPLLVDGLIFVIVLFTIVALVGILRQIQKRRAADLKVD
jgi:hypothetical protein